VDLGNPPTSRSPHKEAPGHPLFSGTHVTYKEKAFAVWREVSRLFLNTAESKKSVALIFTLYRVIFEGNAVILAVVELGDFLRSLTMQYFSLLVPAGRRFCGSGVGNI